MERPCGGQRNEYKSVLQYKYMCIESGVVVHMHACEEQIVSVRLCLEKKGTDKEW